MHPMLNTAIAAARKAGDIIVRAMDRLDQVKYKEKSPNDFVSEVDQRAEDIIIGTLKTAYPEHNMLAEESGTHDQDSDYTWIIDPLDGTRNFLHGFPHFGVSIALKLKNRIEHGVVYDPVRQELFTASRGRGAQLNGRRLRVSEQKQMEKALIGTGFPFRHCEVRRTAYMRTLEAFLPITGDLRRAGAAALDLAYVASGRLDGFWEIGLKPWDIAAGALIVQEAGGLIGNFASSEEILTHGNIVAGNPKIFKGILQIIHPHMPKELHC